MFTFYIFYKSILYKSNKRRALMIPYDKKRKFFGTNRVSPFLTKNVDRKTEVMRYR